MKDRQGGIRKISKNFPESMTSTLGKGSPNTKENMVSIKSNIQRFMKGTSKQKNSKKFGMPSTINHPIRQGGSPPLYKNSDHSNKIHSKYFSGGDLKQERSRTPGQLKEHIRAKSKKKNTFSPSPGSKKVKRGSPKTPNTNLDILNHSKLLRRIQAGSGSPSGQLRAPKTSGRSKSNAQTMFMNMKGKSNGFKYSVKDQSHMGGSREEELHEMATKMGNNQQIHRIQGFHSKNFSMNISSPKNKLTRTGMGSPGSPSQYRVADLLDASKYHGELYQLDGELQVTYKCITHQTKRAKYFVHETEKVLEATSTSLPFLRGVCSRCGVHLSQMGFQVESMDFNDEKKELIKEFMKKLRDIESYQGKILEDTNSRLLKLNEHYNREFAYVEDFDQNLKEIITMMQKNIAKIKAIMIENSNTEIEKYRIQKSEIENELHSLTGTRKEMEANIDEILKNFNITRIREILSEYSQEIEKMNQSCQKRENSSAVLLSVSRVDENEIYTQGTNICNWFSIEKKELLSSLQQDSNLGGSNLLKSHHERLSNAPDLGNLSNSQMEVQRLQEHQQQDQKQLHGSLPNQRTLSNSNNNAEDSYYEDEPLKVDNLKNNSKSSVFMSFNDKESMFWKEGVEEGLNRIPVQPSNFANGVKRPGHVRKNSTSKYISRLDEISKSQEKKNQFYQPLVGSKATQDEEPSSSRTNGNVNNSTLKQTSSNLEQSTHRSRNSNINDNSEEDNMSSHHLPQSGRGQRVITSSGHVGEGDSSLYEPQSETFFVLAPTEGEFANKQTPDLGGQKEYPDHLRGPLDRMKQANNNGEHPMARHVESTNNDPSPKNRGEQLDGDIFEYFGQRNQQEESGGDGFSKCHKVLFDEPFARNTTTQRRQLSRSNFGVDGGQLMGQSDNRDYSFWMEEKVKKLEDFFILDQSKISVTCFS